MAAGDITVLVDGAAAPDLQLEWLLADLRAAPSRSVDYVVSVDDHDGRGLLRLISELNDAAIASAVGDLVLHAGAVGGVDGGCAILCGPSGSGKSTLTASLLSHDLYYLTDEVVRLAPATLQLQTFRKPILLKPGSEGASPSLGRLLAKDTVPKSGGSWVLPPSAFDETILQGRRWWPKVLVFPTFRAGAQCQVRQLSEAEAAFALGANSSRLKDVEPEPLPALARLVRRAPAFEILHGDVDEATRVVLELLAQA